MKNGVIVYKGEQVPEKNLTRVVSYIYHPPVSLKEQIINDVKKGLKDDLEGYTVTIDIQINLKEYEKPNK